MKILIAFIVLSGFLLSQPQNDTVIKPPIEEIPTVVKSTVEEIVVNSEETRKASSDLTKEMKKQLEIIKEIKKSAVIAKKLNVVKKVLVKEIGNKKNESVHSNAIKRDTVIIQHEGQLIKYDYVKKTLFGIVFFSGYYPYIFDENNQKKYLK